MALVIVSGLPCSGRTARCKELLEDFGRRIAEDEALRNEGKTDGPSTRSALRLVHLQNEDANVDRHAFAEQVTEKPSRAAYLSLVMRHLSRDAIVFADGGAGTNIKGFRYQLYCAAREVGARCVSVFCVAKGEACKVRNEERLKASPGRAADAYDAEVLDELLMRFEEPNPMTRWDSPLFVVDCDPEKGDEGDAGPSRAAEDAGWEQAPLDAIWQAVTSGQVSKAPDVVAPIRATSGNYLSMLEATTQTVLSTLQSQAASGMMSDMGGEVQLLLPLAPGAGGETKVTMTLPSGKGPPSTATLQRLRRQFVKMHASSSAAQNEIGLVMGSEGGKQNTDSRQGSEAIERARVVGSSRAERKVQAFELQGKRQVDVRRSKQAQDEQRKDGDTGGATPSTAEQIIARRFAAWLEETL